MAMTAFHRPQPIPMTTPYYLAGSTSGPRRALPNGGARLPFAHAHANANASPYKIEIDQRNGQDCEVIVIEDSPDLQDLQPSGKRRRHDNGSAMQNDADDSYRDYETKRSGIMVGQKRKHGELAAASHNREHYAPSAPARNLKAVKAKSPPALPCDDKEGHFIPRVGEHLGAGRYRIISLLGQGTFGKVVKCVDIERPIRQVAIKVIRAVQKYRDASKVEIRVLKRLRERDPDNNHNCIHMLECFDDRNHICIVTELLSVSVFDFLKDNDYAPFPQIHIQKFAKQLLDSVAFLHELGLVHTDLKPENILLVDDGSFTGQRSPNQTKTQRILRNASIRLIDFGSATFQEDYHASVVSTRHYRAPEIILSLGWSFPCDIWSIGCILVELYTGEALFQTHENVEHLAMMERVFDFMPYDFAKRASKSKPEWFNKYYHIDYPTAATSRQSRKFVKAVKRIDETIKTESTADTRFHDLVTRLLIWDPENRATAKQSLKHTYFHLSLPEPLTV